MKKRILTAASFVMALVTAIFAATPALAYTAVNGNNALNFNKYLIVDETARIPAMTFSYTIVAGTAVDATATTPAVMAGVGTPTVGTAAFASGETTNNAVQSGDSLTLASGKKYAKKVVNVDFSGVSFTQPGIYRYVLTETINPSNKAVSYDTQVSQSGTARTRYIDVYVNDNNGSLAVGSYVLHETSAVTTVATEGASVSDKSSGFVNEVTTYDLTFGKEVTGNQGSKDKYFKFTLNIMDAQPDSTYEVDLTRAATEPTQTAATTYSSMTNPSAILMTGVGAKTIEFYLKDGEYITVKGLPAGSKYALQETPEDYTQSEGIAAENNINSEAHSDPVTNETSGITGNVKTGYTNDRSGVVPTGVILTVAPFAIGLLVFGALAITFVSKSMRRSY